MSEDGVFDGHEHEADVFRVGGAGEVGVQRLLFVRVLFLVHFQDELLSRAGVLLGSCRFRGRAVRNRKTPGPIAGGGGVRPNSLT